MSLVRIDEHGEVTQTLRLSRRETHRADPGIKKGRQKLAALNAISEMAAKSSDIRQILPVAADKVTELIETDAVLIFLMHEDSSEFLLEESRGAPQEPLTPEEREAITDKFKALNETVNKTAKALVVEGVTGSPLPTDSESGSQIIVPLRSGGKVIGTLHVFRSSPCNFSNDETSLLNCAGNIIGVALNDAYLHRGMKQTLTQLQQSEESYRALFEGAYDAIWVHDLDGKMLAANKACEKLTGYSIEELMKNNICHLLSSNSQVCLNEVEKGLQRREGVDRRCEGEVVKKSGDKAIIQVTTSLIMHNNHPVGFQHCGRDVTEERRLQDNIHYYLKQVTIAQEEERKRVARELHDEILQRLIAISRQLEKITSSDALWEESLQTVRDFKKQVEVAVHEVRRFTRDLRPSILDDLGLLPALELLADDLERQGISTTFKVIGDSRRLMPEAEVMLFRIAQEAMANIRRHSHSSVAELVIEFLDFKVRLSVNDNGNGFKVPPNAGDLASSGKLGLAGMQERTRLLGGGFMLDSKPGKGTTVTVEVPIHALLAECIST
jgi:PAS domain S-box-containing protein